MSVSERFKCEDCGEVREPNTSCEECGGRVHEYLPMEAPVYQVNVGGFGPIWFNADDYEGAFQHATGRRMEDAGDDHDQESEIILVDFEGSVEVPVADV